MTTWPIIVWHRSRNAGRRAFTLTEMLISMALCALVMVGVVYTHVFGLKMATLTNSKLSATHEAREALNRVRDEIRAGKLLYVGNGDADTFSHIALESPQVGNALQIYPTVDTNHYVRYYLDGADQSLKRKASGNSETEEIARYITNQLVFRAEDHWGNVLTNDRNNRVIRMTLDFFQWEFPVARVGEGQYYDSYRLQTRITRRAIE
jgi:prepilin-type N-terminal cleavage/methylation domain-containing protein